MLASLRLEQRTGETSAEAGVLRAPAAMYVYGDEVVRWIERRCVAPRARAACTALMFCAGLAACASPGEMAGIGPGDTVDPIRNANLTARFPSAAGLGTQPLGAASGGARLYP